MTQQRRLLSVDALRGFDMFWLIGGAWIFTALHESYPNPVTEYLAGQLRHSRWHGLTFYDCIFPLFLFLVGVSITLSTDANQSKTGMRSILRRTAMLFMLGVLIDYVSIDTNVLFGILQRIALCYCAVALLYRYCEPRHLLVLATAMLLAYAYVLCAIPLPGASEVSFERGKNWPNYIDSLVFRFLFSPTLGKGYDPEGLLSTVPALSTTIIGVLAGRKLLVTDIRQRCLWLAPAALMLLLLGLLWATYLPINKRLWTPSYVLVTGGINLSLLLCFHLIIDVCGRRNWALVFLWIGANALAAYCLSSLLQLEDRSAELYFHIAPSVSASSFTLTLAVTHLATMLGVCYLLYRRRIYLRV